MSFLFPRTVTVTRPPDGVPQAGSQPYSALSAASETTIAVGLSARIELWRIGAKPVEHLPADAPMQPLWKVIISWNNPPALGTFQLRDVVTDDAGMRYQCVSAEWESGLGWRLTCQQLVT